MEQWFAAFPLWANLLVALGALYLLIRAAAVTVAGAVAVAIRLTISPLIIGTTIVAMSTSLAELAVNMVVVTSDRDTAVIVGNIMGSNLVNLGLGLGIPAMLMRITTSTVVMEKEILLYFAVTALLTGFVLDGRLTRLEGVLLVGCFGIVLFLLYQYARREKRTPHLEETWPQAQHSATQAPVLASTTRSLLALLGGLVLLVLAAQLLIAPVSVLARTLGISPYIIGLTVIGIGTSLPEIAASIQAARTGHIDLVLGNVFGSNVFNICIGLGLPMTIKPIRVAPPGLHDISYINLYGLMLAFILLLEGRITGGKNVINRGGGVVIVALYGAYLLYKIVARA
jgi:cation:H+ antiporter